MSKIAIKSLIESLKKCTNLKEIQTYFNKYRNSNSIDNPNKLFHEIKKNISKFGDIEKQKLIKTCMNINLGYYYSKQKEYQKSLTYLEKANEYVSHSLTKKTETENGKEIFLEVNYNLGCLYLEFNFYKSKRNIEKAFKCFHNVIKFHSKKDIFYFRSINCVSVLFHTLASSTAIDLEKKQYLYLCKSIESNSFFIKEFEKSFQDTRSITLELEFLYLVTCFNIFGQEIIKGYFSEYNFEKILDMSEKIHNCDRRSQVLKYYPQLHNNKIIYEILFHPYIEFIQSQLNMEYNTNLLKKCFELLIKINKKIIDIFTISIVNEPQNVAHYTSFSVAKFLLQGSEIRLNSIMNVNDPNESQLITSLCGLESKFNHDIYLLCFSLNPDDLTQYRLYGNEGKLANGLSIIFNGKLTKKNLFDSDLKSMDQINKETLSLADVLEKKHLSLPLLQVIYIATQQTSFFELDENNFQVFLPEKTVSTFYNEGKQNPEYDRYKLEQKGKCEKIKQHILELSSLYKNELSHLKAQIKETQDIFLNQISINNILSYMMSFIAPVIKDVAYQNENEFRVFLRTNSFKLLHNDTTNGKKYVPMQKIGKYIKEIILGCDFDPIEEKELRQICQDEGLTFPIKRSKLPYKGT